MKTLIIVPAYNEEDSILNTVNDIMQNHPEVDILVINDASRDKTQEILKRNRIRHLDVPINLGIGGGVQLGYLYAFEHEYDIAVQMDGDGQHPASELYKLLLPIEKGEADIVVGSRFIDKCGFQSSILRRLGIKLLSLLIYSVTKKRIYDVTSGYRAVNRKYIDIFSKEYAQDYPEPEALVLAANRKARICEVPVIMKERQGGVSSISSFKSSFYYMIKVSLAIVIRKFEEV